MLENARKKYILQQSSIKGKKKRSIRPVYKISTSMSTSGVFTGLKVEKPKPAWFSLVILHQTEPSDLTSEPDGEIALCSHRRGPVAKPELLQQLLSVISLWTERSSDLDVKSHFIPFRRDLGRYLMELNNHYEANKAPLSAT